MRTMVRSLRAAAITLAVLAGLILASGPGLAQAPVPTHDVGDAVGFGANFDLAALAGPLLDGIRAQYEGNANITINELNLTGSADLWTTMEVVGETATEYTIREESATGVQARFVASVTSNLFPAAGRYPGTQDPPFGCIPPQIPYTTSTSSADISIAYLSTSSGLSKWNVSDFALRESRTNYTIDLRAAASLRNVPAIEFNTTACEIIVTYEDSDHAVTADIDAEIRVIFTPALNYFDFPINHDEFWSASSDAIVAGRISGTFDVTGLDPDEEQEFFDAINAYLTASGLTVTGLTGFPITLQDITVAVAADTYLRDGTLDDIPVPVWLDLHAEQATMTLADGAFHTVYLISSVPAGGLTYPRCSWVYSPDDGFIVGYICEIQPGISVFELENVPTGTAETEIGDTKSGYRIDVLAGNPVLDFFLKPPFLGIILLVAIAVIGILLMRRRRGDAALPPVPPPPPST